MDFKKNERIDEEFNNFMFKVNEVTNIINKLSSNDKNLQEIGGIEAKKYLGETKAVQLENVDEENVVLKISSNKTLINRKALENRDEETKSREAFMAEVSKDAEQRYQDKLIRSERMETFKKRATLAFQRGEYEKALSCYNKAIEQIRDNTSLYNNRALTYIRLKFYDKAIEDLKWALKLNENSLKSWLLLAKAHYFTENTEKFGESILEAQRRNPGKENVIHDYIKSFAEL